MTELSREEHDVTTVSVAIVQQSPSVLDLEEGTQRACQYIRTATEAGATLVVFPEAWLGGYPAWIFDQAGWDDPVAKRNHGRFVRASATIPGRHVARIRQAASDNAVSVVLGLNERADDTSGTVYNTQLSINSTGEILNHHRKLIPTHTERTVWAPGDAHGLRTVNTANARLGGLICWEHWNPIARYALHAEHEQLHVAAWPDTSEPHHLASRSYAFEGRCFVVVAGQYLATDDVPADLRHSYSRGASAQSTDQLLFDGGSGLIGPDSRWIIEPVRGQPALVQADVDLDECDEQRQDLDIGGHYTRPELFHVRIDNTRHSVIETTR